MNRHLKAAASLFLVSCLATLTGGTAARADTSKSGTGAKATGVRFTGRSPSYSVYLQLAGTGRKVDGGQPVKDADGYVWFDPCAFRLTVEQTPQLKAFSYEVSLNPMLITNLDMRVAMSDGVRAATANGGGAAALAASTDGGAAPLPTECGKLPEELQRFVGQYRVLRRAVEDTQTVLDAKEASLEQARPVRSLEELVFEDEQRIWELQHISAPAAKIERARQRLAADQGRLKAARASAPNQTKLLQDIDALRRELAARQDRLTAHRFPLDPTRARISVGGELLFGDRQGEPWVSVDVREE